MLIREATFFYIVLLAKLIQITCIIFTQLAILAKKTYPRKVHTQFQKYYRSSLCKRLVRNRISNQLNTGLVWTLIEPKTSALERLSRVTNQRVFFILQISLHISSSYTLFYCVKSKINVYTTVQPIAQFKQKFVLVLVLGIASCT